MSARRSVRILGHALIVAAMLLGVESVALLAIKLVLKPRAAFLFYTAPTIPKSDFDYYGRVRDPLLGWPAPESFGGAAYDASGSRYIPSFPMPGTECVTLYGDSYMYGNEVGHAEAWSNLLSQRLGCRVGNFGVGGYGIDQAYLRFLLRSEDPAHVVLLGIYPEDILRNLTQYVYFLHGDHPLSLKPRFEIDDGHLSLVPAPSWRYEELDAAVRRPQGAFLHDAFLPDSRYGPVTLRFPYTWQLLKAALSERTRNWMRGVPSWVDFLSAAHPTRALPLTLLIVQDFAAVAQERAKDMAVVVFPTPSSFAYFREHGVITTQPLLDGLAERGIRYVELSRGIARYLGDRDYCELVVGRDCRGHYTAEGNQVVAELVGQYLDQGLFRRE